MLTKRVIFESTVFWNDFYRTYKVVVFLMLSNLKVAFFKTQNLEYVVFFDTETNGDKKQVKKTGGFQPANLLFDLGNVVVVSKQIFNYTFPLIVEFGSQFKQKHIIHQKFHL